MKLKSILLPGINKNNEYSVISIGRLGKEAYGSSNELIIVDHCFRKLQIETISKNFDEVVTGVRCAEISGGILCACSKLLWIFGPAVSKPEDCLNLWRAYLTLEFLEEISQMSWNHIASKFIVSHGTKLSIFSNDEENGFQFKLQYLLKNSAPSDLIEFSSDGLFFATASKMESHAKVWYQYSHTASKSECRKSLSLFAYSELEELQKKEPYLFEYLPHPQPIVSLSWRRNSSVCNSDVICNALLTSCSDCVSRIWVEDLWDHFTQARVGISSVEALVCSSQKNKNNSGELRRLWPYVSFHVVISISNPSYCQTFSPEGKTKETDDLTKPQSLVLYWLNNKEVEITTYFSYIFGDENKKETTDIESRIHINKIHQSAIKRWNLGPDIVFAIAPWDGSFLTWSIEHLDSAARCRSHSPTYYFLSAIAMAIPLGIANSVSSCLVYHTSEVIYNGSFRIQHSRSDSVYSSASTNQRDNLTSKEIDLPLHYAPKIFLNQCSYLFTSHGDGTLNAWRLEYSDHHSFSSVQNITHLYDLVGPLKNVSFISSHPFLPFIAVLVNNPSNLPHFYDSELFIWHLNPLAHSLSLDNSWVIHGWARLKNSLSCSLFSWLFPTHVIQHETIFFMLPMSCGISIFNFSSSNTSSSFHNTSVKVDEIEAVLLGINHNLVLDCSKNIPYLFLNSETLKFSEPNQEIFIIYGIEKGSQILHIWNLLQPSKKFSSRFFVATVSSPLLESNFSQKVQPTLRSLHLGSFPLTLSCEGEWTTFSHPYFNPHEGSDYFLVVHVPFNGNSDIFEVSFDINNPSSDDFKLTSLKYQIDVLKNPSSFSGLKKLIDSTDHSQLIKLSCFSYRNVATLCQVTQSSTTNTPPDFVVSIFSNRSICNNYWKAEAVFNLSFSIFDLTQPLSNSSAINNEISMAWNWLEGDGLIFSVCLMGKIFLFGSCSNSSHNKQDNFGNFTNEWTKLSTYNYDYFNDVPCCSTWAIGCVFVFSCGRSVLVYEPDDYISSLEGYTGFEAPVSSSGELGILLSKSSFQNILSFTHTQALILLNCQQIALSAISTLFSYIKEFNLQQLKPNYCQSNKNIVSDKNQKSLHFFSIFQPIIQQLISSFFSKEQKDNFPSSIKPEELLDVCLEDESTQVIKEESDWTTLTPTQLSEILDSVSFCDVDDATIKIVSIIAKFFSEVKLMEKNGVTLDSLGFQYFFSAFIQKQGAVLGLTTQIVSSFHYLCAFHSSSKNQLMQHLGFLNNDGLTWVEARLYGLPLWICSEEYRNRVLELIAKGEYQRTHDPLDPALFYILLKKQPVVAALFKSQKNSKMADFFSKKFFSEEEKLLATKNGYHLLSIHRYNHAVVFFLLAGKVNEAIQICITSLKDIQLGFLIAYFSNAVSTNIFQNFLKQDILGSQCQDPFLRSIGYWMLENYIESLLTLDDSFTLKNEPESNISIAKLQALVIFEYLFLHIKIRKYFSYEKQGLIDSIIHRETVVTHEYIQILYLQCLYSAMRKTIKSGMPDIAALVYFRFRFCKYHTNVNSFSLVSTDLQQSDITSNTFSVRQSRNYIIISRSLIFSALLRCFIEDLKKAPKSNTFNILLHYFHMLKFFSINKMEDENSLTQAKLTFENLKGNSCFDDTKSFSIFCPFIVLVIRHLLLYGLKYMSLIIHLTVFLSNEDFFEKKSFLDSSHLYFPSLLVSSPSSTLIFSINELLSCLCRSISSTLQNNLSLFSHNICDEYPVEALVVVENVQKIAIAVSEGLFISLGGSHVSELISELQSQSDLFLVKNNEIFSPLGDNAEYIEKKIRNDVTLAFWSEGQRLNLGQGFRGPLVLGVEILVCCLTAFLVNAIFNRNALICKKISEFPKQINQEWSKYFGTPFIVRKGYKNLSESTIIDEKDPFSPDKNIRHTFSFSISSMPPTDQSEMRLFLPPNDFIHRKFLMPPDSSSSYFYSSHLINSKLYFNYAWSIMAAIICGNQVRAIKKLLQTLNLSTSKIFSFSTTIYSLVIFLNKLRSFLLHNIERQTYPLGFLPFQFPHCSHEKVELHDHCNELRKLFSDPSNSPFQSSYFINEAKLWSMLASEPTICDEMLLLSCPTPYDDYTTDNDKKPNLDYSEIFVDPFCIYQFSYNKTNPSMLAVATQDEIIELKLSFSGISSLVDCPLNSRSSSQFTLCQFLQSAKLRTNKKPNYLDQTAEVSKSCQILSPVIVKHKLSRPISSLIIEAHPFGPYYLATNESRVLVYQYGGPTHLHEFDECIVEKIVKLSFNDHGSKFGFMDESGVLNLFLFNPCLDQRPFFRQECHNKFGSGFCFLGSTSLIATCGHSTDGLDVALWDTLMPPRSRQICTFLSHEHGCTTVSYSQYNQSLVIGGRRGGLSLFDLRKQEILGLLPQAHETAISCIEVNHGFIASGSVDGYIKTWNSNDPFKGPIESISEFPPKISNTNKARNPTVQCIKIHNRYLLSSSQGVLSIRLLDPHDTLSE